MDDTQGKYLHFLRIALFGQRRPVLPKLLQNAVGKFSGEEAFYCSVSQQSSSLFEIFMTKDRNPKEGTLHFDLIIPSFVSFVLQNAMYQAVS